MQYIGRDLDRAVAQFAAAADSGDTSIAAVAIGRNRGEHGVGIGPSLDDLEAVHRIVLGTDPTSALVRAFADAWAEGAFGALLTRGALDQRTGLATVDYLATRLRDLARTGTTAEYLLVLTEPQAPPEPMLASFLRSAKVARELASSFPDGETPIGLGDGSTIAVIVPTGGAFAANVARASIAVGVIDGLRRAEIRTFELPASEDAVPGFISAL